MSLAGTPESTKSRSVSNLEETLARVAQWILARGVAVDKVAETMRQAIVVALLGARHPGLEAPGSDPATRLPIELFESLGEWFTETDPADVAQSLLEWEVREATGVGHEIAVDATDPPMVLVSSPTTRRARGVYFTPTKLVESLVDRALAPWNNAPRDLDRVTVLDPACGDGRFLVAAARWIWQRIEQNGTPDPKIRRRVITHCLFGIDLDPLSVHLARHAVWQAAELPGSPPRELVDHLVTADALLDCPFPDDDVDRFELVIGNPPFGSFSGRQALAIDPDLKQKYLARWGGDAWDTLHGMFVRRSLELAGHSLALVLPTQITHLESYDELRSAVTREMSVHDVRDHGEDVFEGEAVAPVVTLIARRDDTGTAKWTDTVTPGWVTELRGRGDSLGRLVGDPGVHTGNCANRLVSPLADTSTETDTGVGLLEGKQVHRWRCDPPAKTLKLDYCADDGEYFTIRPLKTYRRARFVIRQTARHPIVGPKRGTEYFRNSLLALFDPDNGYDVGYVVGLLNSRLIRFLYTTSVRESAQASFPQVKVGSLRDLPIIWPDLDDSGQRAAYRSIVEDVARLLELRGSGPTVETLESRIDECVMSIYGLSGSARDDVFACT